MNWQEVLNEAHNLGSTKDILRRRLIGEMAGYTKRNVITYYSGWLQKDGLPVDFGINDSDMNGFMACIHGLERDKGLDLILHTPGGSLAAVEAIIKYLCSMFEDIRAIVPQLAMSAGTMLSLSCDSILMGKHSSLGPIDPQVNGLPAHAILEDWNKARADIISNPNLFHVWEPILRKYTPALICECTKSIAWAEEIVKDRLQSRMLSDAVVKEALADNIVKELGSHELTKNHGRHIDINRLQALQVKVEPLEADNDLQDKVLSVHHASLLTLTSSNAFKIIENQKGCSYVMSAEV
ncbi:MAG: S49 family peptidase [Candidatus Eremiobacteraeota bacterium]|nr:S49 family peptidase [Candidatus Eremiobacteraeota bacterium]MCW5869243.1 S49 family peptidase [Candidatus Eremiobacteraeota bacterium]